MYASAARGNYTRGTGGSARMRQTRWAPHVMLLGLLWFSLNTLAEPEIRIERDRDAIRVEAKLLVNAHHHIAWQVLTDYNNQAAFVPGLRTSRIVSAPGEPLLVRQTGQSGFLFFNVPVEVVTRIEEFPLEAIRFYSVSGNLKSKSGEWRIEALGEATLVSYQANIVSDFWIPPLIGAAVMGQDIKAKLMGVGQEMQQRAAFPASRISEKGVKQ